MLSAREIVAIGHYLCHKYAIDGCAYTEELAAQAAGHHGGGDGAGGGGGGDGGGLLGANAAALLPPDAEIQLLVPPAEGCLAHASPLQPAALRPCDENDAAQRWRWDGADRTLAWAGDAAQCLTWFAERQSWGVWACEYDAAALEWDGLRRMVRVAVLARP